MDGLNEVESVASVVVESSFVTCPVRADENLVGTKDFGGGGVEEIMVGDVGSDVFVDVVSGIHDRSRDGLGEDSDVDIVGDYHETYNDGLGGNGINEDTKFVKNDATVEDNRVFRNVSNSGDQVSRGGDVEVVETEGVESALESNAETTIVVMTTEVELRKEVEHQGLVDGMRDEVEDGGLVDKEVITVLEMAKEGINCVGHSSHSSVLDDEVWNPGIVSVSASCSVKLDTDAVQHEIIRKESVATIQVNNSSLDDEIMSAHEVIETAEVSVLGNVNQTSTCPLMIGTDEITREERYSAVQHEIIREESVAMIQVNNSSLDDEIMSAHEVIETAEVSVLGNVNQTSTCPLMIETDGEQEQEGAAVPQQRTLSLKDDKGAPEMGAKTSCGVSVLHNANHTSTACPMMLETDGLQQEEGAAMVVTESELSIPDDVNHTSASCPVKFETDGVHNEVVKEEDVAMLQEKDLSLEDEIPAVHEINETDPQVMNDTQVIDTNGTHDKSDGTGHACEVKAADCTISPISDQKDANFGIHCIVEDNMEASGSANPDLSCQHDSQIKIGFDIGVGTGHAFPGEPPHVIEQEEVPESHVEFDVKPDNENHDICSSENILMKQEEVSCGSAGGEDIAPESTQEYLSDVDRGDCTVMDYEDVHDMKGEAIGLDVHMEDICCTGNTGVPMTGDKELAQSDLSVLEVHEHVVTGDIEALASKEDKNFVGLSDAKEFPQETEKLDALDGGSAEKAITENTLVPSGEQIITTAACSVRSHESIIKEEDKFSGRNPQSAVEMFDTSGTDSTVEGSVPSETEKEEELIQANQISGHECQRDNKVCEVASSAEVSNQTSSHKLHCDDKISSERACGLPTSLVQTSGGYSAIAEGNNDNVLLYGSQKLNRSADIHENETTEAPIWEVASSAGGSSLVIGRKDEDPETTGEDNLLAVVPQASSVDDQTSLILGEHYADRVLNDSGQPMTSARDTSGMNQSEILEEGNIQSSSHPILVAGEQCVDRGQNDREQTLGVNNDACKIDRSEVLEEEKIQPSNPLSVHQLGYFGPSVTHGEFSVSDLVWGKVRSHPWWPGQIFDPSDASDRAVKYMKKDSYLVAYFGDGTFAWNDASVLKPFRPHFSQIVKQRNSEVMRIAINSALDEVSRRVELGLSCSCTPKDAYEKIEHQIVENAGIREESSHRGGVDETSRAALFEPDKLLEHIRVSARSPLDLSDRLELAIAKAQLSSFSHFKGYRPPPLFESITTSFEDDQKTLTDKPDGEFMDAEPISSGTSPSHRQKESMKDNLQIKERSLSELMVYTEFSPDEEYGTDGKPSSKSVGVSSGKKRKAVDSAGDGSDRRVSIYAAKVSTTLLSPKPSFKVGDCIRRVATQLTGAASGLKSNNGQQPVGDAFLQPCNSSPRGNVNFSPESSTLGDMLSQLQLAAREPKKAYGLVKNIIVFLSDFRKSVVSKHAVSKSGGNRKRKAPQAVGGSTEEFEFDDVNDSYWKDKAIENYTDEQLLQNGDKSDDGYQPIVSRPTKMHKPARRAYNRKQYSTVSHETLADEQMEDVHILKQEMSPSPAKIQKTTRRPYNRKQYSTVSHETLADEPLEIDQSLKRDTSPAELIMKFVEGSHIPSQTSLNNMFRRFGPLKESETEVDQNNCRARVIFKKGADAKVAYSSAGTFNIFGSMNVTYQLSYSPSSTIFEMPLIMSQVQVDASQNVHTMLQ